LSQRVIQPTPGATRSRQSVIARTKIELRKSMNMLSRFVCVCALLGVFILSAAGCTSVPTLTPTPIPPTRIPTTVPTVLPTSTQPPTSIPTVSPTATRLPTSAPTVVSMGTSSAASPTSAIVSNEVCLACHGPIEKVVQGTANYTYADGSKINPHTTVDPTASKPHESGKGIVACTKCHQPHPQPLASLKDVVKADVTYCFGCHHQGVFTPCIKCHEGYK
jgi:predicted CXXCH cytochrome family protein